VHDLPHIPLLPPLHPPHLHHPPHLQHLGGLLFYFREEAKEIQSRIGKGNTLVVEVWS
jgi:hypothetical protein